MTVVDDGTLCQWLRENSSGVSRLTAFAADRIEDLKKQLEIRNREFEALSKRLKTVESEVAYFRRWTSGRV